MILQVYIELKEHIFQCLQFYVERNRLSQRMNDRERVGRPVSWRKTVRGAVVIFGVWVKLLCVETGLTAAGDLLKTRAA